MTTAASSPRADLALWEWNGGDLVITRVFDAPRELVYRAWTETDRFVRWFGPRGSTLPFCEMDVRPGGAIHFCHRLPGGEDVWVKGAYDEVAAPERIVFTFFFSDPAGSRLERAGFAAETRVTVTFTQQERGTKVVIRHAGLVRDQGELEGWLESLDRLEGLLAGR